MILPKLPTSYELTEMFLNEGNKTSLPEAVKLDKLVSISKNPIYDLSVIKYTGEMWKLLLFKYKHWEETNQKSWFDFNAYLDLIFTKSFVPH